jgi:hypothetical protein
MQLHRVLAAEDSPPVAQEDERRRAVAPAVSEPHLLSLVVAQDYVGEIVGTLGGCGAWRRWSRLCAMPLTAAALRSSLASVLAVPVIAPIDSFLPALADRNSAGNEGRGWSDH